MKVWCSWQDPSSPGSSQRLAPSGNAQPAGTKNTSHGRRPVLFLAKLQLVIYSWAGSWKVGSQRGQPIRDEHTETQQTVVLSDFQHCIPLRDHMLPPGRLYFFQLEVKIKHSSTSSKSLLAQMDCPQTSGWYHNGWTHYSSLVWEVVLTIPPLFCCEYLLVF